MLLYEDQLRLSRAQAAAIDEAIGTTAGHPQQVCAAVDGWTGRQRQRPAAPQRPPAQEVDFAAQRNSQARQAAISRAWAAGGSRNLPVRTGRVSNEKRSLGHLRLANQMMFRGVPG